MGKRDIVVIGTSAGGVEALSQLVNKLPVDLPASIFVVLHFPVESTSFLPNILKRHGELPAKHPASGEKIERGMIYVAPPNLHMVVRDGTVNLTRNPRENGFRPSIDPLFRSAARNFGSRVIGVILSGYLGDGVAGLMAIKNAGGVTIVQDPENALYPSLPINAIKMVRVDQILPIEGIATAIQELVGSETDPGEDAMTEQDWESEQVQEDVTQYEQGETPHTDSILTCPECGGTLWELQDGKLINYRCHVGHTYNEDSLLAEQSEALESALWTAVRTMKERAILLHRLASKINPTSSNATKQRFLERAQEAERDAELITTLILSGKSDE